MPTHCQFFVEAQTFDPQSFFHMPATSEEPKHIVLELPLSPEQGPETVSFS
jgi:hypothetical protein